MGVLKPVDPRVMPAMPAMLTLLALLAFPSAAQSGDPEAGQSAGTAKEYQVKAVFLFNFVQFVQWPPESFSGPQSPLVMGILGDAPFNTYLDEVVQGEKVDGRPIKVVRYGKVEEVKECHLLFVSASESSNLAPILDALKSRRILTVGESEDFSEQGGMVSFVTRGGRLRLKVNRDAMQAAGLTVSSKLLRLAEIVSPGKG